MTETSDSNQQIRNSKYQTTSTDNSIENFHENKYRCVRCGRYYHRCMCRYHRHKYGHRYSNPNKECMCCMLMRIFVIIGIIYMVFYSNDIMKQQTPKTKI